jgi:hypothetical protein
MDVDDVDMDDGTFVEENADGAFAENDESNAEPPFKRRKID